MKPQGVKNGLAGGDSGNFKISKVASLQGKYERSLKWAFVVCILIPTTTAKIKIGDVPLSV